MQAPKHYQEELALLGGSTWNNKPRYLLHWLGDPMPTCESQKFASPCDCWALLQWVDTDSEHPDHGGGYVVLQPFRDGLNPTMLESEALNLNVLRMMVATAEKTRHDFIRMRHKILMARREREEKETEQRIADYLQDRAPARTGAISYIGLDSCRDPVLIQKMEQIEKNLPRTNRFSQEMGRGPAVRKP